MKFINTTLNVNVFDAQPGDERESHIALFAIALWVVVLLWQGMFMLCFKLDATWMMLVFSQSQALVVCIVLSATAIALYKKFNSGLSLSALKWLRAQRVGYVVTSTIQILVNSLRASLQRMELRSMQAVARARSALGLVHLALFARLIPTPLIRRA